MTREEILVGLNLVALLLANDTVSVLQLVGLLQLALRHPGMANSPQVSRTALLFVQGARDYFAACPTVLDVIARGDDPSEDRPW